MGLYSDLKYQSVTLAGATKSAAFFIPGGMTILELETDANWTQADVTFEASSQEFDGSLGFVLDSSKFKPCYKSDGAAVQADQVPASSHQNVGATLVGHYFKLVSSQSQGSPTPTTVLIAYRVIA